jgi:hypothetical protein
MLCRRIIISFCSDIHTKHINKLCGQNVELLTFKLAVHTVTTELSRVIYKELFTFSTYRAVNTLRLCYKNQSVNVP